MTRVWIFSDTRHCNRWMARQRAWASSCECTVCREWTLGRSGLVERRDEVERSRAAHIAHDAPRRSERQRGGVNGPAGHPQVRLPQTLLLALLLVYKNEGWAARACVHACVRDEKSECAWEQQNMRQATLCRSSPARSSPGPPWYHHSEAEQVEPSLPCGAWSLAPPPPCLVPHCANPMLRVGRDVSNGPQQCQTNPLETCQILPDVDSWLFRSRMLALASDANSPQIPRPHAPSLVKVCAFPQYPRSTMQQCVLTARDTK